MKKPLNPVSDHALLRWLELRAGLDLDAARNAIGRHVDTGLAHGAAGVRSGGMLFVLSAGGVVVDIHPASRPPLHIGRYRRRREIDDG